jgi:predicted Zn finger-like uncharacterized protein
VIIACPNCLTRFRLDTERLPQPRPMLKCSRCRHVFPGPWAGGKTRRPRAAAAEPASEPETRSFLFDDDDDWHHPGPSAPETREKEFALDVEDAPGTPPLAAVRRPEIVPTRPAEPAAAPNPPVVAPEMSWSDNEDEPQVEVPVEKQPFRISLRPVLILLVLVVASYAVLARTLYANPEWAYGLIRRVPVLGDGLKSQLFNDQVDLIKVEGGYQRTKEGKVFFLVKGEALNHAAVPLTRVQVVARLLDQNGNVLQEKPTFCGSSVPLAVLRDLSLDAMAIIPHLKPSDRMVIDPGQTSPFVIVFTDVSAPVAELTTEVIAAQGQV